jgi:hypothetical protein
VFLLLTKYYLVDQIRTARGGAYVTRGKMEGCRQSFGEERWEEAHLKDLGLDGKIILK